MKHIFWLSLVSMFLLGQGCETPQPTANVDIESIQQAAETAQELQDKLETIQEEVTELRESELTPIPASVTELVPTPKPAPVVIPEPTPPPQPAPVPVQQTCCKICSKGKACGDSCISRSYTCHKPPGCACNG